MTTTVKRISIALSKEDLRVLDMLTRRLGETPSQVIKRTLIYFCAQEIDQKRGKKK